MKTDRVRRTCWDIWRYRLLMARRVRREKAGQGWMVQLIAIFAVLVASMPAPVAVSPAAVELSPGMIRRRQRAEAIGIPVRYVDHAWNGMIPFEVLFRDLQGRLPTSTQAMAIEVLKRQVPEAADWIGNRGQAMEWSDIRKCLGANDDDTRSRLVAAAMTWTSDLEVAAAGRHDLTPGGGGFRP